MTRQRLFFILLFVGVVLFAIFVWPTPERFRDYREWAKKDSTEVEYDAMRDTPTGHAVGRAQQAADDMKKMDDAVRETTKH
jgi:hypothetical protein